MNQSQPLNDDDRLRLAMLLLPAPRWVKSCHGTDGDGVTWYSWHTVPDDRPEVVDWLRQQFNAKDWPAVPNVPPRCGHAAGFVFIDEPTATA